MDYDITDGRTASNLHAKTLVSILTSVFNNEMGLLEAQSSRSLGLQQQGDAGQGVKRV